VELSRVWTGPRLRPKGSDRNNLQRRDRPLASRRKRGRLKVVRTSPVHLSLLTFNSIPTD
jgi:hypothetical protein